MEQRQKIFAFITPCAGVSAADLALLMQFEAAHVWALYERGVVRDVWSRTDSPGAVYVLEATLEEAGALLAGQPMARARVVDVELAPVAAFTCFADLFGTQAEPVPPAVPPIAREPWRRTQRIVAVNRPVSGASRDELDEHAAHEARQTWALAKAGVIREAHRRTDRPGAVVLLESSLAEARALLDDLPLARAGLEHFDLYEVGAFTGLDALLDGAV
jgi:hypothetical protein